MKKILIVDDEEKIQNIYVRTFVEMGVIVRQARNAQEAINIIIREEIDLRERLFQMLVHPLQLVGAGEGGAPRRWLFISTFGSLRIRGPDTAYP